MNTRITFTETMFSKDILRGTLTFITTHHGKLMDEQRCLVTADKSSESFESMPGEEHLPVALAVDEVNNAAHTMVQTLWSAKVGAQPIVWVHS